MPVKQPDRREHSGKSENTGTAALPQDRFSSVNLCAPSVNLCVKLFPVNLRVPSVTLRVKLFKRQRLSVYRQKQPA